MLTIPFPFKRAFLLALLYLSASLAWAKESQNVTVVADLSYKNGETLTSYEKERCKLDLYLPAGKKDFSTLVWFHGGGLTAGSKDDSFTVKVAEQFAKSGVAIAAVNYRLSPKATFPAYVDDAAAAIAWVRSHIKEHGGDVSKVFAGGHSAGAYLVSLIAMDTKYLAKYELKPTDLAGFIPVSGQMMTHFTVREERGLDKNAIIADDAAPIHFLHKNVPPILILYADNEWPARIEENQYFIAALKVAGAKNVSQLLIRDRSHGSIVGKMSEPGDPGLKAITTFIFSPLAKIKSSQ